MNALSLSKIYIVRCNGQIWSVAFPQACNTLALMDQVLGKLNQFLWQLVWVLYGHYSIIPFRSTCPIRTTVRFSIFLVKLRVNPCYFALYLTLYLTRHNASLIHVEISTDVWTCWNNTNHLWRGQALRLYPLIMPSPAHNFKVSLFWCHLTNLFISLWISYTQYVTWSLFLFIYLLQVDSISLNALNWFFHDKEISKACWA